MIREAMTPGGVKAGGFGPSTRVGVPPGGVRAGGFAPSASVPVLPGGVRTGGFGPAELIGPGVVLAYAVVPKTHEGYHLAADPKDLIAYGTDLGLVLGVIFVGGRLVAGRLFRST
jgi:hypothetical protein